MLTSNLWLPIIRGDLRLFTGGIAIDTGQHGPHTLPFRFHLAALATQTEGLGAGAHIPASRGRRRGDAGQCAP